VDEGDRRGVDRLTIQEAARQLGVSEGAVRKRVARGSLQHEKQDDGRIYVYVSVRDRRGVDDVQDAGVDPNSSALISQLRDEVAYLRDESRRKDEIIMQQAMTMRQITAASQDPSERAESQASTATQHEQAQRPTEGVEHDASTLREWAGDVEASRSDSEAGETQEVIQEPQRPWWRRMWG
jgi:excisionase family DNA binding protein